MKTSRWLALWPLFSALLCTGAQAQSKTYKCMIDGRTVFQQSACPVSAEPEAAKPAAEASAARVLTPTSARTGAKAASSAAAAASVAASSPAEATKPAAKR